MYRHAAESIKETSSRNFISQTEKDKYNNYEIIMRSVEDSYSKTEVDNKIKELSDNTYGNVEDTYIIESNTLDGYVKDLEILGNTIQNTEDLSDIKSVGTLQEDATYNMSIVSCGKNLFDGELFNGSVRIEDGSIAINADRVSTDFIPVKPSHSYTRNTISNFSLVWVCFYDNLKSFIGYHPTANVTTFDTPDNCYYVRFSIQKTAITETETNYLKTVIQLEEGTVATPYESYKESRVDINLPCQLEKVGEVSDRLYYDGIEKAWCIEKNIYNFKLNDIKNFTIAGMMENGDKMRIWSSVISHHISIKVGVNDCVIICDKFKAIPYINMRKPTSIENVCIKNYETTLNEIQFNIDPSRLGTDKGLSYIKSLDLKCWVVRATPQKIILPLSAQIQLNSYANRTHIYTLSGEVEGTIKATLPKSLGASVQSLNDKTDIMNERIKSIETLKEGQNLSYESDKGYVLCENTNNGQIDNIKIEGRTLVNLWDINNIKTSGQVVIKKNKITATTTTNTFSNFFLQNNSIIKSTTDYTIIVDVYKNTLPSSDNIYITSFNGIDDRDVFSSDYNSQFTIGGGYTGRYVKKYTTVSDTDMINKTLRSFISNRSAVEGSEVELSIMLIEGDHMQTHSSYFEGLMSVGGDVDEIEVISRKEDGNLFDISLWNDIELTGNPIFTTDFSNNSITIHGNGKDIYTRTGATGAYTCPSNEKKYLIKVTPNTTYTLSLDLEGEGELSSYIQQFDIDYNSIKVIRYDNKLTFTTDSRCYYVGIRVGIYENNTNIITFSNIMLEKNDTNSEYVPYKSHNKSLLYYNDLGELTPVTELHEWDSIEKHSDGKWYYHKRTHKIVLDGSENWYLNGNLINDVGYQYVAKLDSLIPYENITTTIVKSDNFKDSSSHVEVDCLWLHKGRLVVIHSKLGLEELKSWLQSNNTTFVFKMLDESEEQVYECVNLNLDTYDNETMVMCNTGTILPKLSFNVSSHIGSTVSILRERLKQIEEAFTKDKISQNTFQLNTMYSSDKLVFSVNIYACSINEYDEDLFTLITEVLLAGKDNYNLAKMEEIIDFYTMIGKLSFDMADVLFEIIENQINPPVIEIPEEEITILPEI